MDLNFLVEWSCTKEGINERGPYTFVEWSCANKTNKSVWTLILGQMVVHKKKNERGPYTFDEWSCTYKEINQCGP